MVTKQELLQHFQKNPEKYWKVELFNREGFVRKVCPNCGYGYWTLQKNRTHCPQPECGEPVIVKKRKGPDYFGTWKMLQKFFEKHNHTTINRYPTISRWHPNLFFTIASIQDFMRFSPELTFEYPENPLLVPQICLRFSDIENVGKTGRHHTGFVMVGQHAFNEKGKEVYWMDGCEDLHWKFYVEEMKIPKEQIVFREDVWTMPDFSALGPCFEEFAYGNEMQTSVFMQFRYNGQLKELPVKVVDIGWGLERIAWFLNGTETTYEIAFGPVLVKMLDVTGAKNKNELQALHAVAEYARTLLFAISDGGMPSNVSGGYNLRIILRRALSFIEKFGWSLKLEDVSHWHAKYLKKMFPELAENEKEIEEILTVETNRYKQTRERAKKIIETLKTRKLSVEDLQKLYESDGITPEQLGLETPSDFYVRLTQKHMGQKLEEEKPQIDVSGLPATKILYYDEPYIYEFQAKVLKVLNENFVLLDQTAFYPTSGGQLHDMGTIDNIAVTDVFKVGDVIVHRLFGKVDEGKTVKCVIDKKRREILIKHHDAVHVINGVAKKILGKHVHQHGAEKDVDKARLDITHHEALTPEEAEKIEQEANKIVEKDLKITKKVIDRSEAEKKFGFDIYAGGYVPSKQIRLIDIEKHDVEACGGTHGNNTKDIGWITITKTKRIADGLVRIELKAGEVAENYLREKVKILSEVSKRLKVPEERVPATIQKMFDEWKRLRKRAK